MNVLNFKTLFYCYRAQGNGFLQSSGDSKNRKRTHLLGDKLKMRRCSVVILHLQVMRIPSIRVILVNSGRGRAVD